MAFKKPYPTSFDRLSLPTAKDLQLAVQVLAIHDSDNIGMGPLLTLWHHELGMTIESIAKSWNIKPHRIRTWMRWYKLEVIDDFSNLPVRSVTQLKGVRAFRRQQHIKLVPVRERQVNAKLDDDASLNLFLREIGCIPLLTFREERELAFHIQNASEPDRSWALHEMTESNLRFVVSVAKRYQGHGFSLADLINEGAVGCMKAAGRFDHTRGFKFISYAVWWIRQAILDALSGKGRAVRLPLNRQNLIVKVRRASVAFEQKFSRVPELNELETEIGVPEREIFEAQQLAHSHMSLDTPFDSGDSRSDSLLHILADGGQASPDQQMIDQSLRLEIEKALDSLTSREAEVMTLYFGLGDEKELTLEEIGARLSLTRERVRQIKEKALKRMRHASRSRALRAYHDEKD